ncbi:uncharacterized protein [Aristolochia californica]|uniref:uncharacterized protein n=1 Tax=Aristolochia californica TaxID=171875 RepID=UPI0035D8825B
MKQQSIYCGPTQHKALIRLHNLTQFGKKIKVLRCNNAKEYISNDLDYFCHENSIIHQTTCVYTPQQKGVAKWKTTFVMRMDFPEQNDLEPPNWRLIHHQYLLYTGNNFSILKEKCYGPGLILARCLTIGIRAGAHVASSNPGISKLSGGGDLEAG